MFGLRQKEIRTPFWHSGLLTTFLGIALTSRVHARTDTGDEAENATETENNPDTENDGDVVEGNEAGGDVPSVPVEVLTLQGILAMFAAAFVGLSGGGSGGGGGGGGSAFRIRSVDDGRATDTGADDSATTIRGAIAVSSADFTLSLIGATTGQYGSARIDGNGWAFTTDAAAIDTLNGGEQVTVDFTVRATEVVPPDEADTREAAQDDASFSVVLVGANDAPVLAAITASTGDTTVGATGDTTATGQLAVTDRDDGDTTFTYLARAGSSGDFMESGTDGITGTYGTLTITDSGAWTYTLTAELPVVASTDVFTIKARDDSNADSNEQTLTITVLSGFTPGQNAPGNEGEERTHGMDFDPEMPDGSESSDTTQYDVM